MEWIKIIFDMIPAAASSGLGFAAYALGVALCAFFIWRVIRNKNLLEHIEKLPPKDRLRAFEIETGGVRVTKGLSPEQWLRARIHRYYLFAFLAICAVAVAIVALATLKGANIAHVVNNIHNDYRQFNSGQGLSSSDLQRIQEIVEAGKARDTARALTAYNQLSAPARAAYVRVYPAEKDNLIAPVELSAAGQSILPQAAVSVREAEPNDDIFKANEIPLNAVISAAIEQNSDVDYFTFTMPGTRRDYIDVILNNESTTLAPRITVYNPDKSEQKQTQNTTRGGDVSYAFVAQPGTPNYIKISAYFEYGNYRLTVRARNAYDRYEPNDDILNASPIAIGQTVEANIMDPYDIDYYRFDTANQVKLVAMLENRSATLAPRITLYDQNKSEGPKKEDSTRGANVSLAFEAAANSTYYIKVSAYFDYGDYRLTIRPQ